MNNKKGYISVEAVVLATLITVAGLAVLNETKDAIYLTAVRALGLDMRLTQDLDEVVNIPYSYETDEPSTWTNDESTSLKDSVSLGQVIQRNIELNIPRAQSKFVGETLQVVATIDGVLSEENKVYWTILSGAENGILSCSGLGCSTADVVLLQKGVMIIRASDQNKTTYKDVVITIQ